MFKIAINQVTTMKSSFEEDIIAYRAAGFGAMGLWLDKLDPYLEKNSLDSAKKMLIDNGLKPISACFHYGLMLSEGKQRQENIESFQKKLEICQALDVPILMVPTDFPETVNKPDYERAVQGIREAAQMSQKYHVKLAIEFIKGAKFIATLETALDLVRKSQASNVGILFDTFHFYAGASKFESIRTMKKDELFLVHINDILPTYLEIAADSDRTCPGKRVLPLTDMINAIVDTGYEDFYSIELFNEKIWEVSPVDAAKLCYDTTTAFFESLHHI